MAAELDIVPAPLESPVTIRLKRPIEFGSERVEELSFRKGRAGDLRGIKLGLEIQADTLITIAARLCGRTTAVIERLDEADCGEVFALALGFIGRCLGTGPTPSPS